MENKKRGKQKIMKGRKEWQRGQGSKMKEERKNKGGNKKMEIKKREKKKIMKGNERRDKVRTTKRQGERE